MSYKIVPTQNFGRELKSLAKKHRSIKANVIELVCQLEANPIMGDEVVEHCFKIRMAITSKNKGKSGGARVITYVYVAQEMVFLLSIYDKGEQEDISNHEIKALIADLGLEY
jgi:mRNA-degrading endonuclease RelE of RelBE toxin-antitoxin system